MLETERLVIIPLNYNQMLKYIQADNSLEQELGIKASAREIVPELKEALEQSILPSVADPSKDYVYSTLWSIIDRNNRERVGDFCFKGEPNPAGEIEIGYGIDTAFQNRGYITEAIGAAVKWAAAQPAVQFVTAETEKDNLPSMRVLEKCGFSRFEETDTMIGWRLSVR
ncbi:GNAT family N-acetyltransferase [Nibrella saemangeumensis]|uniref:GNAT family N-acetyltransferase n=1 Tax=Nibrella saemangeumensis TaxID=1084526 RepID=A0ABP8MEB3_9BACT